MQIFLNSLIQLIIEQEADKCWNNLFIISKITAFISDEYENESFQDIMITQWLNNNVSLSFEIISYIYNVYILLYYVFMFSYNNAD